MGSKEASSSDVVDDVRNMSISRRGGVRTRGGRLPPIRMREIAHVTGARKTVAPRIPPRRTAARKEASTEPSPLVKKETPDGFSSERGRGRGRGRGTKVFLQMEGTFLADGPAARTKKERDISECYRVPRASRSSASETSSKVDLEAVRDLLSFYEENNAYEDDFGTIPPYRLPLLKKEVVPKVTAQPLEVKIKAEPLDEDDIKAKIKSEDDAWNPFEGKYFTKIKSETPSPAEEFFNVKDEGMLILLKWPNCLPFAKNQADSDAKDGDKPKQTEESQTATSFVDSLPEGRIGKLQVLKSGKKRLVFGSVAFELEDGIESQSLKEVVSIRTDEQGGDMTVLGKIERTMVVKPLIENIVWKRDDVKKT